ncbi:transposase [Actinomadura sp. NPDC047616]|uniref:transposase n=1 Tax=Actinomadura sp. NPDC047616 TaxID=3155914 RepID=UPI0033E6396C
MPPSPTWPQVAGGAGTAIGRVPAAIVFVATTGCTWRQLPRVFGASWQTVYRRFAHVDPGPSVGQAAPDHAGRLGAAGELNWSRCAIRLGQRPRGQGSWQAPVLSPPANLGRRSICWSIVPECRCVSGSWPPTPTASRRRGRWPRASRRSARAVARAARDRARSTPTRNMTTPGCARHHPVHRPPRHSVLHQAGPLSSSPLLAVLFGKTRARGCSA